MMFEKYDAYKDSGICLIGNIPEKWFGKKLKFITQINSSSLPENHPKNDTISYVDIGNVSYEKGIGDVQQFKFSESPSRARRIANCGDTVVSTVRTYLKAIAYVNEKESEYIYSTGFAVLSPNEELNPRFLLNFVRSNSFTNQVDIVAKGMSYPAINSTELANLWVAFPDKPTQEKIVAFLDQKTSEIDQAIVIKEQQIALLNERKQIVIQKAVTQGLDPNVPMKDSGVEWIGQIPEHWKVLKFKRACQFIYDGTHGSYPRVEQGYRLLSVRNIIDNEFVFREDDSCVSQKHFKEISSKFLIRNDDIQLAIVGGTLGKAAIVKNLEEDIVTQRSLATLRTQPKVLNPNFLLSFIRSPKYQNFLWSNAGFSAQPGVYLNTIQNSYLCMPCLKEQNLITEYIESETTKFSYLIGNIKEQIEKLKEYKTTLINDAVTGKIKVA